MNLLQGMSFQTFELGYMLVNLVFLLKFSYKTEV